MTKTTPEKQPLQTPEKPKKEVPKMAKVPVLCIALTPQQKQLWDMLAASLNIGPSTMARKVIEHTLMQAKIDGESQYELKQILGVATGVPTKKGKDKGKRIELLASAEDLKRLQDWQLVFKEPRLSRVVLKILRIFLYNPPVFSADETAALRAALAEFSRVGSNLNQLVHQLNTIVQDKRINAEMKQEDLELLLHEIEVLAGHCLDCKKRTRKILLAGVNAGKSTRI